MIGKVSVFVRIRCPFSTGTTVRFQRDLVSEITGIRTNHSIVDSYPLSNRKFDEVKVKTLEALIQELDLKKIDFLKMDCEGAEYSIFNSTPDSIFDRIITISMEFHDIKDKNCTANNLIEKLMDNKFRIVKFHYEKTSMNLNYGKIIGTRIYNQQNF